MEDFKSLSRNSSMKKISSSLQKIFKNITECRDRGIVEHNIKDIELLKTLCKVENVQICLMSCQTFVRLVGCGVLEMENVLSMLIAMLPHSSFSQYAAITEGILSLLMLDLRQRTASMKINEQYVCPYGLKTPQHPLIMVIQNDGCNMNDIANKINGICNHHDIEIRENCINFLRPVLLYIFCNPETLHDSKGIWTSLLEQTSTSPEALVVIEEILTWSQIASPVSCLFSSIIMIEAINHFLHIKEHRLIIDLCLYLAVIVNYQTSYGSDPRPSFHCISKVLHSIRDIDINFFNVLLVLLSQTLHTICPNYFPELIKILFFIIVTEQCGNKYILNMVLDGTIQWMSQTDFIECESLSLAQQIVNKILRSNGNEQVKNVSTDAFNSNARYFHADISIAFDLAKLAEEFDKSEHKSVFTFVDTLSSNVGLEFSRRINLFLRAIFLSKDISIDCWFKVYQLILSIVKNSEDIAVDFMMTFIFKLSRETNPETQLELLRGLPTFAIGKDSIPMILNTIKTLSLGPNAMLCLDLYLRLWKIENRTYPFLHKLLCEPFNEKGSESTYHIAKASTIREICISKPSQHGADLVYHLSNILNFCSTENDDLSTAIALDAITALCESNTVNVISTWKALSGKFRHEKRIKALKSLFNFFSFVPILYTPTVEHEALIDEALDQLWFVITRSDSVELIKVAIKALANYELGRIMFLKHMPLKFQNEASHQKRLDSSDKQDNLISYMETISGECWIELLRKINPNCISEVADLLSHYIEIDIKTYRSGIYQLHEGKPEPRKLITLGKDSVLRAVVNYLNQQSRLGDQMNESLVVTNALRAISKKFSKPIPPLDWCFLHSFYHMGFETRKYCILIANNQIKHSGTAKRLLENFLVEFEPNCFEEDLILLLSLFPALADGVTAHVLKAFVEKLAIYCFKESQINGFMEGCLFEKFLESVKLVFNNKSETIETLDIFTLVTERYMDSMDLNSRLFEKYTEVVCTLHPHSIDSLTSPSMWWEVPIGKLKKATVIRCYLVLYNVELDNPLIWLNPIVDAYAERVNEQSFFLYHLGVTLYTFNDNKKACTWIMDIFGQIQALLADSTNIKNSNKIVFLLDVFVLSIVAFSGSAVLLGNLETVATSRNARNEIFPESLQILCERVFWKDNEVKIYEILHHMYKNSSIPITYSNLFRNSIICSRNKPYFHNKGVWTKYVGMKN